MNFLLLIALPIILKAERPLPFDIFLIPPNQKKTISVYQNGNFNSQFDPSSFPPLASCNPTPSFEIDKSGQVLPLKMTLFNPTPYLQTIIETQAILKNDNTIITVTIKLDSGSLAVKPISESSFAITHTCKEGVAYTSENYWSPYEFTCDASYRAIHFDWSLLILLILATVAVAILARFDSHPQSLKVFLPKICHQDSFSKVYFQGFKLNAWFLLGYGIIYLLIALSASIFPEPMKFPSLILINGIGLLCCWFMLNETFCLLPAGTNLQKTIFRPVRVCDIISLILSSLIITFYYLSSKAWYINDIISVSIIGTFIKIFKIPNLKVAVIILLPCAGLDIILALVNHYVSDQSYDTLVLKYFNYPLELELPFFKPHFDKKCSWISIVNIILAGLVMSYGLRFDISKNTRIYTVFSFFGQLLGLILWMFIQIWNKHAWPISLFSYVLMILTMLMWAKKRGELKILWLGGFYDIVLMDPFEINSRSSSSNQEKVEDLNPNLSALITKNEEPQLSKSKFKLDQKLFQGINPSTMQLLKDSNNIQEEEKEQGAIMDSQWTIEK